MKIIISVCKEKVHFTLMFYLKQNKEVQPVHEVLKSSNFRHFCQVCRLGK